ncbi:MAG: Zn-dependent exopeptidase M28 [Kiritimatiellae bacterium]|nr:Zn-dependent exopeptidase M28 [Kiritimatiellia bacterium]
MAAARRSIAAAALIAAAGCARIEPERPAFGALELVNGLCAIGPRVSGTIGAAEAAAWIGRELDDAGLLPIVDAFTESTPAGQTVFRNVMATLPGKTRKNILLLSHYDTKSGIADDFSGANDSGSSTALLLALARWFAANPYDGATLTFAFLDGEECREEYGRSDGLHGSRHLAAQMKGARVRLDAVILLDMVGDSDLTLTIPANVDRRLMATLQQAASRLGISEKVRHKPVDMIDDHQPFLDLGYPAIDIIDFEYGSAPGLNDYWHTAGDTIDKISDASLDEVGAIVIEMIRSL